MTVLWTVRAAEPTAAFSPQRKGKTVEVQVPPPATISSGYNGFEVISTLFCLFIENEEIL